MELLERHQSITFAEQVEGDKDALLFLDNDGHALDRAAHHRQKDPAIGIVVILREVPVKIPTDVADIILLDSASVSEIEDALHEAGERARNRRDSAQELEDLRSIQKYSDACVHDLNNMLTALSLTVDVSLPDSMGKAKSDLKKTSDMLSEVVAQWSHVLQARGNEPVGKDVSAILEVAIETAKAIRPQFPTVIDYSQPGKDYTARIVPVGLTRVFMNILFNAADASPEKAPIWACCESEGDWVTVTIRDRGPGIPKEHLEAILAGGFTTKAGGSGIGLSSSRRAVNSWGGDIEIKSTPGETNVIVRLPKAHLG